VETGNISDRYSLDGNGKTSEIFEMPKILKGDRHGTRLKKVVKS
jgi:hypothetical protein